MKLGCQCSVMSAYPGLNPSRDLLRDCEIFADGSFAALVQSVAPVLTWSRAVYESIFSTNCNIFWLPARVPYLQDTRIISGGEKWSKMKMRIVWSKFNSVLLHLWWTSQKYKLNNLWRNEEPFFDFFAKYKLVDNEKSKNKVNTIFVTVEKV